MACQALIPRIKCSLLLHSSACCDGTVINEEAHRPSLAGIHRWKHYCARLVEAIVAARTPRGKKPIGDTVSTCSPRLRFSRTAGQAVIRVPRYSLELF